MTPRPIFISASEAADRVSSGAGLVVPGNAFRLSPETLLAAIESRFMQTKAPRDLSLYFPMIVEAARGGIAVPGTGFNRLAHRGLLTRVVGGSFSRLPT